MYDVSNNIRTLNNFNVPILCLGRYQFFRVPGRFFQIIVLEQSNTYKVITINNISYDFMSI